MFRIKNLASSNPERALSKWNNHHWQSGYQFTWGWVALWWSGLDMVKSNWYGCLVGEIENKSNMGHGVKLDQVIRFSDWVYNTDWESKVESPGFIKFFLSICSIEWWWKENNINHKWGTNQRVNLIIIRWKTVKLFRASNMDEFWQ